MDIQAMLDIIQNAVLFVLNTRLFDNSIFGSLFFWIASTEVMLFGIKIYLESV